MNYTLYIDESGDFSSARGQWIISGVLFCEKYENCENILRSKFSTAPNELNLTSIKDFHLTEFRRNYGHDEAVSMAKKVLHKLDSLPFEYHFLTTINYSKTSLSNREKTYRLMLADILSLCETVLDENKNINKLDLVVATRTINGVLQTNVSNIQEDIINSLPIAFEVDLATRGMIDLIGKHINIKMDYANNSWGLVCADFLANLTYHNQKENEKEYFKHLIEIGKYTNFESFGDFETRRANISERDKDYVLALYRWLKIINKNSLNEMSSEIIQRILIKIFNNKGTTGSYISFEALIERLWRNHNKSSQYNELSSIIRVLEEQLIIFFNKNLITNFEAYLFRIRNILLIIYNHLGNTKDAIEITNKQNSSIYKLISNPEYFDLVLNFKSIEIEIYVNCLEFKKALELSNTYIKTINTYKDIWGLMVEEDLEEFEKSRAFIKSKMIEFRIALLNNKTDINLDSLRTKLSNKYDLSRFENYKIMLLLKQNKPKIALDYYTLLIKSNKNIKLNLFDLFWFIKVVNETLFESISINKEEIKNVVEKQIAYINTNDKGHPLDLIFRELAFFYYQLGDKSFALKMIRKSKNTFNLENSNISIWLKILIDIHEDFFKGNLKSEKDYLDLIPQNNLVERINENKNFNSFIKKIRYFSPY